VRVEIRLFATLERFLPPGSRDGVAVLDVPDGSTASEVALRLGIPAGFDRVLLVNGREAPPERTLAPGDVLDLYPPLSGGSAEFGAKSSPILTQTASERSRRATALPGPSECFVVSEPCRAPRPGTSGFPPGGSVS
jgi:molybdopterin synthase sulfur carrier subunit